MTTRDVPMDPGRGGEARIAHARPGLHLGVALAAVVVAFFLVRLLGEPWPHFPPTYPDSFSYLGVARRGPLHGLFFFDERPIGYPLLLWSVGRSPTLTVLAQTGIYVAAFWVMCRVVFAEMRSRVIGVLAVTFIAAIAIEPRNSLWNTLILSESLSTSLGILSIAAWWRAAARPSKRTVTWGWIATVAWILVRDTNVLPTVLVLLPAALACAWVSPGADGALRRRLLTGALAILVLCGYVYVSQAVSHRNQYPVNNNIGMRVLPDPGLTKWFVQGGMPLDDALRARTGHNSWDDGEAFLRAPELARYRSWARGAGSRRLFLSMVLRSPFWWDRIHHDLPDILRETDQAYDNYGVFGRFPHHLPPPLGEPRTTAGLLGWMLLAAAGLGVAAFERRRRLLVAVVALGLLSAIVEIWASYSGDATEVNRHLVGPLARLNVLLILAIALGADAASARLQRASIPVGAVAPGDPREEALAVVHGAPPDA
jgi:hypothetical protein